MSAAATLLATPTLQCAVALHHIWRLPASHTVARAVELLVNEHVDPALVHAVLAQGVVQWHAAAHSAPLDQPEDAIVLVEDEFLLLPPRVYVRLIAALHCRSPGTYPPLAAHFLACEAPLSLTALVLAELQQETCGTALAAPLAATLWTAAARVLPDGALLLDLIARTCTWPLDHCARERVALDLLLSAHDSRRAFGRRLLSEYPAWQPLAAWLQTRPWHPATVALAAGPWVTPPLAFVYSAPPSVADLLETHHPTAAAAAVEALATGSLATVVPLIRAHLHQFTTVETSCALLRLAAGANQDLRAAVYALLDPVVFFAQVCGAA
jgi:hypothetical protein